MGKSTISLKMNRTVSLDKYAGKWVAFLGDKIVGSKKSLKSLMKEMDKKGIDEKVTVFLVPKKKERYLVV